MNGSFRKFLIIVLILCLALTAAYFLYFSKKNNPEPQKIASSENSAAAEKDDNKPADIQQKRELLNETATKTEETQESNSAQDIPEKFTLQMPFYSQAPLSKWDAFHEDMCEEASLLNAALYLEDKKITKSDFEAELQKMKKSEEKEIGEWKSTTVGQIKKFADAYFTDKLNNKIIDNPTAEDIEAAVANGNPVIVPLAGRDIGNPNFTPPGPVYHMLVVKGYDSQNFITNDVGTRKGDSYTYKKEVIMKSMHDWNAKDIHLGVKRILVLYKSQ